jgi:hypothetical protein
MRVLIMNINTFWNLIEQSRCNAEDCAQITENLTSHLEKLEPEEIVGFEKLFWELIEQAYRWDMWAVAYIINGGCSDDGFLYFRGWLISQGRKCFEDAILNPETAADFVIDEQVVEGIECEDILYAARDAYKNKTGAEMPDYDSGEVKGEPDGEPWQEDDLERLYPKLCRRFFA